MFTAVLVLALAVPADAKEKELSEAAKKEVKKLEGKWKAQKMVVNGEEQPAPPNEDESVVEFKGRKCLLGGKEVMEISALDPSTELKCIDLKVVIDFGLPKDKVCEAVYKIDGDTLTIAVHIGEGAKRPTKLESVKDSDVVLATFKREKK